MNRAPMQINDVAIKTKSNNNLLKNIKKMHASSDTITAC